MENTDIIYQENKNSVIYLGNLLDIENKKYTYLELKLENIQVIDELIMKKLKHLIRMNLACNLIQDVKNIQYCQQLVEINLS